MGKKLQEEGVWAPKTPAKSVVCAGGNWKNRVGGNFSAGNSQGSVEFIAVTCSECMNAARALKDGNGNNVFDLNKSADELDFGDSTNDYCEDVLAGKPGENRDQAYLDVTNGAETLLGGVAESSGLMRFGDSSSGGETLGSFSGLPVETPPAFENPAISGGGVGKMPNNLFLPSHSQNDSSVNAPSRLATTQATPRAVAVDKMISSSPESNSEICNCERIPGLLLECDDDLLPGMKPKNNSDREATQIHSFNKDGNFHDEKPKPSVRSTAVSTPSEKRNTRRRHKDDVNLNRKLLQKPRKKKYWPKVVGDKPKKTPKPETPRPSTPKLRTPRLPKHVTPKKGSDKTRKDGKNNKLQASVKPLTVCVDGQIIDPSSDYVPKFSRRALNFDSSLQNHEKEYGKDAKIIIHQNQQWKKKMDGSLHDRESIIQVIEGNELIIEKSANIAFCFNQTKNRVQSSISAAERGASNDPHAKNPTCCHYNFFRVYRRIFRPNQCLRNSRKLGPNFPRICKKRRMKRRKATRLSYFVAVEGRMETQSMTMHSSLRSIVAAEDSQMIARAANDSHAKNLTSCHCNSLKVHQRIFPVNQCLCNSKNLGPNFRRICKKRRMRRQKATKSMWCRFGSSYSDCTVPNSQRGSISPVQCQAADNNPNSIKCELSLVPLSKSKKRSNKSTQRLNLGPLTICPSCDWLPSAPLRQTRNGRFWNLEVLHADNANMVTKSPITLRFFLGNAASDQNRRKGFPKDVLPPTKSFQDEFSMAFRDVVGRLRSLHISDEGGQLLVQNQNVVHKPVILYDSKKRKPPPKVDIDQETMKVWKLLMANGGEEIEEENDKDKETWWEEQREVFRGRVDSFIARMHLVQGDRRFSPWKGSVVDSVVGVFLTQNVSDHLSSSAFLSLAAKYPIQFTTNHKACDQEGEVAYSQESVGSNIGGEVKQELDATGNQSLVSDTELDMGHELVEIKVKETGGAIPDEAEDSAVVQDEFSCQTFMDYLIPANSSSTCKLSVPERSSCSTEKFQSKEPACLQELGSSENVKFLCDESLNCNILKKLANIKQGSNMERLLNANGMHDSVCSPSSLNPYSHIHLMPSDLEADSWDILEDFTNTKTKNVEDNSKNLGYMEPSVHETIIQQKAAPRLQEVTVYHCASLSKCQVLPAYNSHAEVMLAKGWHMREYHLGGSKTIQQTETPLRKKQNKTEEKQINTIDWHDLRKTYAGGRTREAMDSLDWEGVRQATVDEVADTIKERGQHNILAERIKNFLERVVREHGNINLEWLRDVPADKAKDYLLSFKGLGLKSVECVRLLTLHHHAFPVDTNVGRVAVRLGWVPLQPLPESLQIHLLEQYPLLDTIQIYLWPRLCTLDQRTLYELHYQMITFGKVFCRKQKPNCNACPMRGECRHFASAFASARLSLPGPKERSTVSSMVPAAAFQNSNMDITPTTESLLGATLSESRDQMKNYEPIIEHPPSPEPYSTKNLEKDIEDFYAESGDDIPTIRLDTEGLKEKIQDYIYENNIPLEEGDMSKALIALTSEAASIPIPKLKHVSRLRTVHHVYELPDSHPILAGLDKREPDDPSPYLLAIWTSGETANSSKTSSKQCDYQDSELHDEHLSFSCNNSQEQYFQTVCGTILIPCRTATRGNFPLNGTYFQVNEVFADDESSQQPINVPRAWIWNLQRRILYCGAYASAIFRGLSTAEIQNCFWKGYICVRGFNRKIRAPAHLSKRFHVSTSTPRGKTKFTQDEWKIKRMP